jgi:anaerobic magnesium-protoporphyrin IX monomethyl ester cyclase
VIAEVDELVGKYGKEGIMFYDDELNINNATMMPLMEDLIKYQEKIGKSLRFRGFVKAELFTQAQADIMYRAGFRVMLSGVESGDDGILTTMKKHTNRVINKSFVEKSHKAGMQAKALMSIGHPGESEQTINNSLDWVLDAEPDDVDWTIITQYPGSPYFDLSAPHPSKEGVWVFTDPKSKDVLYSQDVNYAEKAEYYKGVPGDYTSYVWTDHLSPQRLVELRDIVEGVSRRALDLPSIQSVAALQFEHSMGQRNLPSSILRSTKD